MQAFTKRMLSLLLTLCMIVSLGTALSTDAAADDEVIAKVLTTLSSPPVALLDPSTITAATSTPGCYIISAGWFDASGNAVTGAFNPETYRLEIQVGTNDGFSIASDVACYLNNSAITSVVAADGKSVTLTREFTAEVWAPTVFKSPGAETVDEGGWASFVVSGSYVREYQWYVVDPTEKISVPMGSLKSTFPGMEYAGDGSTKLKLYHIPYEMNGWKVVCDFIGAGTGNVTRSQPAVITVNPDPSRVIETPEPSPTPTPSPSPTPTPEPVSTPPAHEHDFSGDWHYDARSHWHECAEDGSLGDLSVHTLVWSEVPSASDPQVTVEQGVCEVCGYTVTRSIGNPASASEESADQDKSGSEDADGKAEKIASFTRPTLLITLLLALIPLDILLVVLHSRRSARQKRRRRR